MMIRRYYGTYRCATRRITVIMKKLFSIPVFALVICLTLSCAHNNDTIVFIFDTCENVPKQQLSDLIRNPSKFDGKMVEITGYYSFGFENSNLYTSKSSIGNGSFVYIMMPGKLLKSSSQEADVAWNS